MASYLDLVKPIEDRTATCELLTCAMLANLSYVHDQQPLLNAMRLFLGTGNLEWFETPSSLTSNYVLTAQPDGIVVAFSGTENYSQMLYYSLTSPSLPREDLEGRRCHVGFGDIATDVLTHLLTKIPPSCNGAPITLIGHSLGGAVAQIIAAIIKQTRQFVVKNLVTFGSPTVGGFDFNLLLDDVHKVLVVDSDDIIPLLPPILGINWRSVPSSLETFVIYSYSQLFPQLWVNRQFFYEQITSNFLPWQRFLAESAWQAISNPTLADVPENKINLSPHYMKNYCQNMIDFLRGTSSSCNFAFLQEFLAKINKANVPGPTLGQLSNADFAELVNVLGRSQGLVAQNVTDDDPYLVFYEWCDGKRDDVICTIGLFTEDIPEDKVEISDFVEPRFKGYRRADTDSWAKKEAEGNRWCGAQSGYLTWVTEEVGPAVQVKGIFSVMVGATKQVLLGFAKFPKPIDVGKAGVKISCYCQVVGILRPVETTATKTAAVYPVLYSFSYLDLTRTAGQGSRTNFQNNIIVPNTFPLLPSGQFGPAAGGVRTWWLFRGKDRRMIEALLETLLAIQARDAKVGLGNDKLAPIIDPNDQALNQAVQQLIDQMAFLKRISRT